MADLIKWARDRKKDIEEIAGAFQGGHQVQTVTPEVQQKIATAKYGVLANNPQRQQQFVQSVQPSRPNIPDVARETLQNRALGLGLGATRSITGTAQGLSGLYDLATPGTGTNRLSKGLDRFAQKVDQTAKDEKVGNIYKAGQVGTDLLQFAIPGTGGAKLASKIPTVAKTTKLVSASSNPLVRQTIKIAGKYNDKATALASGGTKGRIAAQAMESVRPANLANMAVGTGLDLGTRSGKGQDISRKDVAVSIGTNVGMGVGLPVAARAGIEGVKIAGPAVQKGAQATQTALKEASPDAVVGRQLAQSNAGYQEVQRSAQQKLQQINRLNQEGKKVPAYLQRGYQNDLDALAEMRSKGKSIGSVNPDYSKVPSPKSSNTGTASGTGQAGNTSIANTSVSSVPPIIDPMQRVFDQNPMNPTRVAIGRPIQNTPQTTLPTSSRVAAQPTSLTTNTGQMQQAGKPSPTPTRPNGSSSETMLPSLNNTSKQLQLKDSTAPFSNGQEKLVKEYSGALKSIEDSATGGQMIPDGNGGYTRTSEHSQFYRNFYSQNRRKPSVSDYEVEARRQLTNKKADPYIQKDFDSLNDPEFRSLVASQEPSTSPASIGDVFRTDPLEGFRQKIKQTSNAKQIPVTKMERKGDTVTASNVNPNIKAREKRYSVDEKGDLIEDRKGAYRLFTNEDGRVTHFRIGNEMFNAKDLGDLSDVNGYGSTLATMRRNIERGFGKETGGKVNAFLVDHQQAQATKLIERRLALNEGLKGVAKDLGINFGGLRTGRAKQVSAAIQDFGEGRIDQAQLAEKFGPEMGNKIARADQWFRGQYDGLLDEMNTVLTQYGYDPVPKRKDYYTHFQEPGLWEKFGLKMQEIRDLTSPTMQDANPAAARGKISNKLAGESEFTQPNKQFNPFALKRTGDERTADAFQSFERYLTPTLSNIYMTPSITRARVLAKAVAQDADTAGVDANKTLIQIKEWANHLAGKSNRLGDRQLADTMMGGKYLKLAQWAQRKAGANSIVGNLATAGLQPVVLAQTTGKMGFQNTILAAMQELSTAHTKDAPIRQSEFMRRRYANLMPVTAKRGERAAEIANTPLKVVEQTVARITWNAAHNEALSKNLTGRAAIKYADVQAEKTLAGRSIGERPELFTSKTAAPATMYQLEVNNYWQQLGEMSTPEKLKTFVAAYAIGLGMTQLLGRDVGFNPIDAAIDSYQEVTSDKPVLDKAKSVGQRLAGEVIDNTPVVPAIAGALVGDENMKKVLGPDSNVGRFGVSSPISALWSTTNIGGVPIPQNVILPFGGSQVKKTIEAAQGLGNGQLSDKNGNALVQIPSTAGNTARGLLFGKGAIPEVNQYYSNIGKKKEDQTEVQNQTDSRAASMGSSGKKESTSDLINAAFSTPQAKEFLKLSDEERKAAAESDPEMRALYDQHSAMKTALGGGKKLYPSNLSSAYAKENLGVDLDPTKVLQKYDRMTAKAKETVFMREPAAEYEYKASEYLRKLSDGQLTRAEETKQRKELTKLYVTKDFDKDTREVYGLTKGQVWDVISKDKDGKAKAEKLLKLGDKLLESKIITNHPFRDKYGNPDFETGSPGYKAAKTAKGGKGSKGGKAKRKAIPGIDSIKTPQLGRVRQATISARAPAKRSFKRARPQIPKIGAIKTPRVNRG